MLKGRWQGYVKLSDDEARRRFMAKYGYRPAKVIQMRAITLAGPIRHVAVRKGGEEDERAAICD